jgi:hypothetical protein
MTQESQQSAGGLTSKRRTIFYAPGSPIDLEFELAKQHIQNSSIFKGGMKRTDVLLTILRFFNKTFPNTID